MQTCPLTVPPRTPPRLPHVAARRDVTATVARRFGRPTSDGDCEGELGGSRCPRRAASRLNESLVTSVRVFGEVGTTARLNLL